MLSCRPFFSPKVAAAFAFAIAGGPAVRGEGAPDVPFAQESRVEYRLPSDAANDVAAIAVGGDADVWVATGAGAFRLAAGGDAWAPAGTGDGPAFDVAPDADGGMWIAQWDGLYRGSRDGAPGRIADAGAPAIVLAALPGGGVLAFGPAGASRVSADGAVEPVALDFAKGARGATIRGEELWIACNLDLHRVRLPRDGTPERLASFPIPHDAVAPAMAAVAFDPEGKVWAGGMGGLVRFGEAVREETIVAGLPNRDVRAIAFDPGGRLWIATALGAARREGDRWALRHGRRWLPDDDARDIAFAPDGTAWIATAAGVAAIRSERATLAGKADRYLEALYARHVREPGLVEKCRLETPGDLSTWKPRDDDNDGQYTAMYLAMESYRYAATRDPEARERARSAFRALRFLREATGTDGFVARTVVPADWTTVADPNETIDDREWARRLAENPRAKRVETRWRPTADGKWLWKGDTSSDELTGHFYGYLIFHELAADENDRREVAEHVAKVMDHIVDNGYVLRDADGLPTLWGVWAPEKLNHDPLWAAERGINSVEILSFLRASHRITGDPRYLAEYRRLARDEGYADNARRAKTINPAVRTHIDDELLALAWPGLFLPGDDPDLEANYREGFEAWRAATAPEGSPFFNFVYAALGPGGDPTLDESLAFLRDAPLDLVRWTADNSTRGDMALSPLPEYEHVQTDRLPPPSERGVIRWDENPWRAVQGDGGRSESDGVFWLLPYWMGRSLGFVEAPAGAR